MNLSKVCPSCRSLNPGAAKTCSVCGHGFRTAVVGQSPTPPRQQTPRQPFAVPVSIQTHSNLPGPLCPRCNSHYVNHLGRQSSGYTVVMLAMIGASFLIWPLVFFIPSILRTCRDSDRWNCHSCGFTYKTQVPEPFRPKLNMPLLSTLAFAVAIIEVVFCVWSSRQPVALDSRQPQSIKSLGGIPFEIAFTWSNSGFSKGRITNTLSQDLFDVSLSGKQKAYLPQYNKLSEREFIWVPMPSSIDESHFFGEQASPMVFAPGQSFHVTVGSDPRLLGDDQLTIKYRLTKDGPIQECHPFLTIDPN